MAITNDDLLLLGFACDALDAHPDDALRMPRHIGDKQFVAVEKVLLREMIERCRQTPPEDDLFDMTGTVARRPPAEDQEVFKSVEELEAAEEDERTERMADARRQDILALEAGLDEER